MHSISPIDYTLNLDTSFTGKDRLYTRLRTGNMDQCVDGQSDSTLNPMQRSGDNTLKVDKLWYSIPNR